MSLYDEIRDELGSCRDYSKSDGSKYLAGICPFHEDSKPSLLVWEDNFFQCQACGRRGTHKTLINSLRSNGRRVSVSPETVEWRQPSLPTTPNELRSFVNMSHLLLSENVSLQWYLEKRGVENRITPNRLGWHKGWYTIPVTGADGSIQGLVIRAGEHIQKATGLRFGFPLGQRPMLFVPDWRLFNSSNRVVVVYGMFDALALADLRIPVCTTTSGKHTFHAEWLEEGGKRCFIVPDRDEEDTASKLAQAIGNRASFIRIKYPEGMKDPADFLQAGKGEVLRSELGRYV